MAGLDRNFHLFSLATLLAFMASLTPQRLPGLLEDIMIRCQVVNLVWVVPPNYGFLNKYLREQMTDYGTRLVIFLSLVSVIWKNVIL